MSWDAEEYGDRSPLDAARAARLSRPGSHPAIALAGGLAGGVDADVLRAAGWTVRVRLAGTPYDPGPRDGVRAVDLDQLLVDPRLDAVCVDGTDPALAGLIPQFRGAGLLLLLPSVAPLDPEPVRAALASPDAADAVVGFVRRYEPWALTVAAALPLAGGNPVQVTVRGWPRGPEPAAELVDLVRSWCGDVVGVVAAPAELPAAELPAVSGPPPSPAAAVAWALLTESGATVLVSHEGGGTVVRLSFSHARLEAAPAGVRWVGGAALPLIDPPLWVVQDPAVPVPPGTPYGLLACAAELTFAVGGREVASDTWPWPADLGDLLVASRVLAALRESARTEQLVTLGS